MVEIGVGIRIDLNEGLSFTGIEAVNDLINRGGVVTAIEAGGAIMRKLGEDGTNVRLTLSGCDIKVIIDDTAVATSPKTLEHNRLFKEGNDLISPYMQLIDQDSAAADSQAARENLERGIELLRQALQINPANWAAYWIIGKAYQALDDSENACDAFKQAYALQKSKADVAREYMFECLKLGRTDKAIAAARHATYLKPDDAGLLANLALALLIGGKLDEAATVVTQALEMAPDDDITRSLRRVIAEVRSGRRPQPEKMSDLGAK